MPERGSKTSMALVVWANLEFFSARDKWFPVTIGDHGRNLVISLWPGDKATMNVVAAWRLTPPQNFRVQKSAGKVLASVFFGIKKASSSLIIFQSGKLSTPSVTHLCWCNWRTFSRKNRRGKVTKGSCSCTIIPCSPGTCNPEETGLPGLPISWSPTLFSGSGLVGLPPVPWTEKTIERSPFFVRRGGHCCRGENSWFFFLVARRS